MDVALLIIAVVLLGLMALAAWRLRDRVVILGEFIAFLRERRLWWVIPMLLVFVLAGLFVVVLAKSGVATFLYVLH